MSDTPPEKEEKQESDNEDQSAIDQPKKNRIIILQEREIPFEEERPPNYSPHFSIKVHRIQKPANQEEQED
ncbi:MAG: hypothetical protein ACFFBR_06620 [Promethearchaeota archaeon]